MSAVPEMTMNDYQVGAEIVPVPHWGKRVWIESVEEMEQMCDATARSLRTVGADPDQGHPGAAMAFGYDHDSKRWYVVALEGVEPGGK